MKKDPKPEKFNFEKMKAGAENANPHIRKQAFTEYFERFGEFPSYLFDNTEKTDSRLMQTIQDLLNDPTISKTMHQGIAALIRRLPAT